MEIFVFIIFIAGVIFFLGYHFGEKDEKKAYEHWKKKQEQNIKNYYNKLEEKFKIIDELCVTNTIFARVAALYADVKTVIFDDTAFDLARKCRPAIKAADEIRAMKAKANLAIAQYKEMSYKYEFMLSQFPELRDYIDDYEALASTIESTTLDEASEMHDRVRDWISDEEYRMLDVDTRNQLALDNYLKRRKLTNVQIGYEYEMYIGHLYRKDGWSVEQFGIDRGLEDLGRDIIATTTVGGKRKVHIIQCKKWSEKKEIHENVVSQLIGTTELYRITHNDVEDVTPVLISTTPLSAMAQKFADHLNVSVRIVKMGDYPRIKCNINKSTGAKIYHLPFDQQYMTAKIEFEGEFYASTVKEATAKGFRRAFRHLSQS